VPNQYGFTVEPHQGSAYNRCVECDEYPWGVNVSQKDQAKHHAKHQREERKIMQATATQKKRKSTGRVFTDAELEQVYEGVKAGGTLADQGRALNVKFPGEYHKMRAALYAKFGDKQVHSVLKKHHKTPLKEQPPKTAKALPQKPVTPDPKKRTVQRKKVAA
jgi:hypothetical protein